MKNIVAELTRRALSAVSNPATAAVPAYPLYRGLSDYVSEVEQPVTERLSERLQHLPSRYGYPINISPGAAKFTAENVLAPSALVGMFVGPRAKGWEGLEGKFSARFDKMPRAEISDAGAKLIAKNLRLADNWTELENILEHPELYEQYPHISKIPVKTDWSMWRRSGEYSKQHPEAYGQEAIKLAEPRSDSQIQDTLLHEIQHAIQEREGWARGGSPEQMIPKINRTSDEVKLILEQSENAASDEAERMLRYGRISPQELREIKDKYNVGLEENNPYYLGDKEALKFHLLEQDPTYESLGKEYNDALRAEKINPYEQYKNLAGEIEARDTAARKDLTLKERMSKMPYESQGIPLEDMIVKTRGDGSRKRALFRAIQNK